MAYLFYTICFVLLVCATGKLPVRRITRSSANIATVLYASRERWKPYTPPIPYLTAPGTIPEPIYNITTYVSNYVNSFRYTRLPTSFAGDVEAGFSSASFDLSENIEAGDSRQGLDDAGKREVQRIMQQRRCNFDEARRLYIEETFGRNGIGADGRPLDRKAVMFDR